MRKIELSPQSGMITLPQVEVKVIIEDEIGCGSSFVPLEELLLYMQTRIYCLETRVAELEK
jgi:hypothetical protein